MKPPSRPGHYRLLAEGKCVGVATIEHFMDGQSRISMGSPTVDSGSRVLTPAFFVPFLRQDEAWNTALEAFCKALNLDPNNIEVSEDPS